MSKILEGKSVLVTGGTGSFGKVLVRRFLSGEAGVPERVIVLSRDEAKQHDMRVAFTRQLAEAGDTSVASRKRLDFRLGDIRSYADVVGAMRGTQIVINAAALKQVPNCEYFPEQAVLTNCIGPANIVRAVGEHGSGVEVVLGISTDKACKPVNVMGMTKALHERIITSANVQLPGTRFICCRYGNVLASRGSVVPLFHEQIRHGGPVTITVPEMTRFLLSLDEAVDCVFDALQNALPGDTYVPIAPAATVEHVALALIDGRNIPIEVTGIRPGERMHEFMISEEECPSTVRVGDYFAIQSMLPELQRPIDKSVSRLTKEFSSADTIIGLEATRQLLSDHGLLVNQLPETLTGELFERAMRPNRVNA